MTAIYKYICDACGLERAKPISAFYESGEIQTFGNPTEYDICSACDFIIRQTIKSLKQDDT